MSGLFPLVLLVASANAQAFVCGNTYCAESSSCCLDGKCGTDTECHPLLIIIIPIAAIFAVALIIACVFALVRRRRKDREAAVRQPLIKPAEPVPTHHRHSSVHSHPSGIRHGRDKRGSSGRSRTNSHS